MTRPTSTTGALDASGYIDERVNNQLAYYATAANRAKRAHYLTQGVMIVLAATVPVVVNLPSDGQPASLLAEPKAWATVMSLMVAVLAGLSNLRKDGDLWLNFRRTEGLIRQELYLFRTSSGAYRSHPNEDARLAALATRVERLIASEHDEFRSLVEDSEHSKRDDASSPA